MGSGGLMANPHPKVGPGRPKGSRNKITLEIRELARKSAPEAMKELVRLAKSAESEAARVAAIKEIFDRGYGKSPQPLDGDGDGGPIKAEISWQAFSV